MCKCMNILGMWTHFQILIQIFFLNQRFLIQKPTNIIIDQNQEK